MASAEQSDNGGDLTLSLQRVSDQLRFTLSNKLEGFSNGSGWASGPAMKTNGYSAAKVPDWQLRQWIAAIDAALAEQVSA